MQTILGGGGAIGNELARELKKYSIRIRIVSRNPKRINEDDELVKGDLTNIEDVKKAVEGSEIVYLVAGLDYKIKVWREKWPLIMKNVIEACETYNSKLVFFDNIYMYDRNFLSNITEETPVRPTSKKGEVRALIASMILNEVKAGKLTALIARSADFYGPGINTSVIQETVYKNFKKGKKGNYLGDPDKIHSITYTPDAARATALLGNTPSAYNQVWHLPTDTQKITGKQMIELFAKEMNLPPKYFSVPVWMIKLMGIFNPLMREIGEMSYQYDRDYYFNSSKFQNHFPDFKTTSYQQGVKEVVSH